MARLIDFALGASERNPMVSQAFAAFSEAVRWGLGTTPIDAPFRKIYVNLDDSIEVDRVAVIALNIVEAYVPGDYTSVVSAPSAEVRATAARITRTALDGISRDVGWDSAALRDIVHAAEGHRGPYRFELRRLRVRDRTTRREYVTSVEIDEEESRAVIDCRSADGIVVASSVVETSSWPAPHDYYFNPRRARLGTETIDYLHANGYVIKTVRRPDIEA